MRVIIKGGIFCWDGGGRESSVPLSGVLPISPALHQRGVAPFGTSFQSALGVSWGNTRRNQRSSRCSASSGLTSIICTPILSVGLVGFLSVTFFFSYVLNVRVIITAKKYGQQRAQHRYGNTGADFINIALF